MDAGASTRRAQPISHAARPPKLSTAAAEIVAAGPEQGRGLISTREIPAAALGHLSRTMAALRLYTSGRITEEQWLHLVAEFRRQWLTQRDRDRAAAQDQEAGPNY